VHVWDLAVAADQAEAESSWDKARNADAAQKATSYQLDERQVQNLTRAFRVIG
jgi:hypothetical protein